MSLSPDLTELLARARADLRMGLPVVFHEDGRGQIFCAVETLAVERFTEICALGESAFLAITGRRAETLKARVYDGDLARILLPSGASLDWLRAVAEPARDLMSPMKGPLQSRRDGDAGAARTALRLVKSARLLPAVLAVEVDAPRDFAALHRLTAVSRVDADEALSRSAPMHPVIHARLPMEVSENGRLHVFRPDDGGEEHYAVEIGRPDRGQPVLARLHSACFTGDLVGSLKCDCGPQLRAALAQMGAEGAGVLLYMNQEGRGIGLANKMRAYALQDQGFDTVEANHRLGFEDDERDFRLGASILNGLGFSSVRLMTNNPSKVAMMQASGLEVVERVPLRVGENRHNTAYLATKVLKSGHLE